MKKERIRALLTTAYCDGFFDSRELFVINARAKDLGLSGEEILDLIRNPEAEEKIYFVTVEEKIDFMYDLMKVILADDKIEEDEETIFYKYLRELGFDSEHHDALFQTMSDSVKAKLTLEEYYHKFFEDEI